MGYRKNDGLNVDPKDVYAPSATGYTDCSGATCHRTDDSANGAYDPNPYP